MSCEKNNNYLHVFEALSTAELEQLLRLYSSDAISMPQESVIAVSTILADRNRKAGTIPRTPEASFATFKERLNHNCTTVSMSASESSAAKSPTTHKANEKRKGNICNNHWKAIRQAIAAISVVFFLGGFVPAVFGATNVFTLIGNWTDSVFSFLKDPNQVEQTKDLNDLHTVVKIVCGIDHVVPTWLPEGMEMVSMESCGDSSSSSVIANFSDGKLNIFFLFSTIYDNAPVNYEKDASDVEEYVVNGQIYYIMSNTENPFCTWAFNHSECQIWGDITVEEIHRIIDSIYKEE